MRIVERSWPLRVTRSFLSIVVMYREAQVFLFKGVVVCVVWVCVCFRCAFVFSGFLVNWGWRWVFQCTTGSLEMTSWVCLAWLFSGRHLIGAFGNRSLLHWDCRELVLLVAEVACTGFTHLDWMRLRGSPRCLQPELSRFRRSCRPNRGFKFRRFFRLNHGFKLIRSFRYD